MMLGAPGYTLVSAWQGGVGASEMVARDNKMMLGYQKYLNNYENKLLQEIGDNVI